MPAHLRVSLPDRPGALASLAGALARSGANVLSVVVVERDAGRAVDDLLLSWPYQRPWDAVVQAVAACDGVRLHGLRHVAGEAPTHDYDVVHQMLVEPGRALTTLVDALPPMLLADWAAVASVDRPREALHASVDAPAPLPVPATAVSRGRAVVVAEQPLLILPVPGTGLRLAVGRNSPPAFTRSELDRCTALAGVTARIARLHGVQPAA